MLYTRRANQRNFLALKKLTEMGTNWYPHGNAKEEFKKDELLEFVATDNRFLSLRKSRTTAQTINNFVYVIQKFDFTLALP